MGAWMLLFTDEIIVTGSVVYFGSMQPEDEDSDSK